MPYTRLRCRVRQSVSINNSTYFNHADRGLWSIPVPSSRTHFRRISLVGLHRMAFPRTRVMTLVLLCVVGTHGPHSPTLYLQEFPKDINSIELLSQSDVIWQLCLNFKDILLFNIIILNYMYYFSQEICHSFFSYSYLISHLTVTILFLITL